MELKRKNNREGDIEGDSRRKENIHTQREREREGER